MVKNPPANVGDARDTGSFSGWGRSPGEGNGNPLQYSCLENPMDRGAWWTTIYGVAESDRLSSRCGMAHGIYIASGIIINLEVIYSIWVYLYVNTASFYIRDLGILRFSYPQGVLVSIPHGYWGWPISLKMPVISGWCTNTGNEKSLSHSLSGKYSYLWIYSMWSLTTCPGISQSSLQLKWCWNFHGRVGNFQSCSGEI